MENNVQIGDLIFRNCQIVYRNFSGIGTEYNQKGDRNFSVLIEDPDIAAQLKEDGWNVKPYRQRDEDAPPKWHLKVKVQYYNRKGEPVKRPPRIYILGRKKVELEEADVSMLDSAFIEDVNLTIRPYQWEKGGDSGITAYLKNMYIKVTVDELDEEFANYGEESDDEIPFD